MAWTATATEMVAEFRNRGGYRRSTAITDAIATSFLNAGIAEVHDLICKHNPDFLVTPDDLVTEADEPLVELPADFYKLRRLDLVEGSTVTKLRPFQFEEEGRIADGTIWDDGVSVGRPRFMLQAGNLRLAPPPSSVLALRLWYIPHATKLVTEATATLDLADHTVRVDTVVAAADSGEGGNDITLAFVADGTGAGTLSEGAYPALVFHYESGVTTVTDFESAVAASTYLDVETAGTGANLITATGDTFSAVNLAGGVTETVYDGVNGHEDLVYEHALRMAKARDRMDTMVHDQAIARLEKRLLSALESRDQSEPEYLADHGRGGGW